MRATLSTHRYDLVRLHPCVVPLAIATGASMNSQRAIGTGVLGGMVTATVLAVFVTPLFYVVIARVFGSVAAGQRMSAPCARGITVP